MRMLLVTLLAFTVALPLRTAMSTSAVSTPVVDASAHSTLRGETESEAGNDDTVAVQLTVLGIVIGAVFLLGSAAYILRWKLGRTAYTPPTDTGSPLTSGAVARAQPTRPIAPRPSHRPADPRATMPSFVKSLRHQSSASPPSPCNSSDG